MRDLVRQELKEAGWLVTSKDAVKFGADFLLYRPPAPHSIGAVFISDNLTALEAQRVSRLCESVGKIGIFAVPSEGRIHYVQAQRWIPHIS